ncbi:hypothetical protein R8Z57_09230 [Microbacterium sp. M3]|uniref:Uncharacterized protein n=1 Tax=Microbacterium arthrosphaerae TaxID=792652 RepID=A0ABU4H0U7_9MICO|nr:MULTISPECIES: hypothetical protein [Microbacterium]MDW4572951.1 hypothetical protein [Microbacterium arthrosphaerae]MDW7606806.1 hypothetical protein [Microbacterium sp. M3]
MSDSRRRIRGNPAAATRAPLRAAANAIVVATATLALAGCAPDPDLGAVESGLAGVDNVTAATASPQHSNFPWETQVNIDLYVEETDEDALVQTVRDIAPVLAADRATSRFETTVNFYEGEPADYGDDGADSFDRAYVPQDGGVFEQELGLTEFAGIVFGPGDVERLAAESD